MKSILLIVISLSLFLELTAQKATIREESMSLKTYMFSDPDPVAKTGRIYPYFKFDGYTNQASERSWNMVILENDYIKVFVCPDIGGKVWGAIEKSTGKEFLYFNSVVKFRDIAMRGAWTSGGLEFNFGDIGHIPTCATPVDYKIRDNGDGSVSCIVGAIDLPSNTRWNIEIKLYDNRAYFETIVSWFSNSSLQTSYYHWMNAAARSSGNLEFIYPGKNFIGHGGEPGSWPMMGDRDISRYENNNFGPYKSYHVMNSYSDFFGGYWHDDNFGFGHYASYDDKPGKKLWIWGLSDQGMIWEDLLTDSDGQYIEYQTGKLFNQAAANSTESPFKHREFTPYDSDIMHELWFPLKNTGGMVAASEYGILNVEYESGQYTIYLSALRDLSEILTIEVDGKRIEEKIELNPLQLYKYKIAGKRESLIDITLGENLLSYSSDENNILVDRPIVSDVDFNWESTYGLFTKALESEKQRMYSEALAEYLQCIEKDPGFLPALSRLSLSYYRRMEYSEALEFSRKALSIDTYDPEANFAYGLINKAMGDLSEAKSGFSIASQSVSMRQASYTELAIIFLGEENYQKAINYAAKALKFNQNNITAFEIIAYSNRRLKQRELAKNAIDRIYKLDALSDFAAYEELCWKNIEEREFKSKITNELPFESYLTLAIKYYQFNDCESATAILKLSPQNPLADLWLASLSKSDGTPYLNRALSASASMVFPYRRETATVLEELIKNNPEWKLKYYLGLIYWNIGRINESRELFSECGETPDLPAFYLAKALLFDDTPDIMRAATLRAYEIDPADWRAGLALCNIYLGEGAANEAGKISGRLLKLFPENPSLGICYARSLLKEKKYKESLTFLESFEILPYEGSQDGKRIYSEVCIELALSAYKKGDYRVAADYAEKSRLWPKNLGVGRPYDVDERLEDYIIALSYDRLGDKSKYSDLASYRGSDYLKENSKLIFQSLALKKLGREREATELIAAARNSEPENRILDWVLAKFNNSPQADILQKSIIDKAAGNQSVTSTDSDSEFDIVIKVLTLTK